MASWPCPGKPWSRLHIDYAGPVESRYFLIIFDPFTKFLDVHHTTSITAEKTITLFRKSFANFSLPDTIVSDNAPTFKSKEFGKFCENHLIKQIFPPPYHPSSNGAAERAVRILKTGLSKFAEGCIDDRISRILYHYRKAVNRATLKTPAETLFGRPFKSPLSSVKHEEKGAYKIMRWKKGCGVCVGQPVFVKNFSNRGDRWLEGVINRKMGSHTFEVEVESDQGLVLHHRHIDQLLPRFIVKDHSIPISRDVVSVPSKESLPLDNNESEEPRVGAEESRVGTEQSRVGTPDHKEEVPELVNSPLMEALPQDSQEIEVPLRRSKRNRKPPEKLSF